MKKLLILAALALSGCSSVTYTDPSGRSVKSSQFLTDRGPSKIVFRDGDKSVEVDLGGSQQAKSLEALAAIANSLK